MTALSVEETTPGLTAETAARARIIAFPARVFVVGAAATAGTLAFGSALASWWFLLPAAAGAAAAVTATLLARRFGLLFGEMVAVAAVLMVVIGPLAVGGVRGFFRGILFSWVEILTTSPPVDLTPVVRTAPFLTAFAATLIGGQLLRGSRFTSLAILGPLASVAVSAMFAFGSDAAPRISGAVLVVGLLLLAMLQWSIPDGLEAGEPTESTQAEEHPWSVHRLLSAGLMLACIAPAAVWLGPLLPLADDVERVDLREFQTPPWDPLALPSPLTTLKASLKSGDDTSLFRIEGDQVQTRWRAAVLPTFTGVNWSVATAGGEADFVPVDSRLPLPEGTLEADSSSSWTITPTSDLGWWVPTAGVATEIEFAADTDADVRMSLQTGTVGAPGGLSIGDRYLITSQPAPTLTDDELSEQLLAVSGAAAQLELVPPSVRNLAADFSTGMPQRSGRRVLAVRDNLQRGSYDLEAPPGHAYGRMAEFLSAVESTTGPDGTPSFDLRPLRGYEELYASSAALLMQLSDINARVVTGWIVPEDRWAGGQAEVLASDANAWIEVQLPGQGWMAVDVTPDRTNEPLDAPEGAEELAVPISEPPKEPPPPEDAENPEIEAPEPEKEQEPDAEDEDDAEAAPVPLAVVGAVAVLVPFALAALAIALVIGLKAARRRRRRSAEDASASVLGAWEEVEERFAELGHPPIASLSPREESRRWKQIESLAPEPLAEPLDRLADAVSRANFHPESPSAQSAAEAWHWYELVSSGLDAQLSTVDRLRTRTDPRPLISSVSGRSGSDGS